MSTAREQRRLLYEKLIGQMVADRYEIVRLMGFGGMGAVYEAVDQNMQRPVALKYIPAHDPVAAERFKREAVTVSNLRHRNTVTVYDRGATDDGFLFLSMELLEGRTLTDVIKADSPMPPARVVHIAGQICRSLGEAHEFGIVHRDVKPDNVILINDDGDPDTVKVLDFGIAKAISGDDDVQLTGDGRIIGTPRYMSPEQILGQGIDNRSDIYSLGCIIFEMLCGAPPFQSSTTTALMISHAQDSPPPFSERLNEEALQSIPVALEQVVRRSMAKNPMERPQSTEALRLELEEALQAQFVERAPQGAFTHTGQVPFPHTHTGQMPFPQTGQAAFTQTGAGPAPFAANNGAPEAKSASNKPLLIGIIALILLLAGLGGAFLFMDGSKDDVEPLAEAPTTPTASELAEVKQEEPSPTPVVLDDTVHLRVITEPSGANVLEEGRVVGTTPFNISVSADVESVDYTLQAEGYRELPVRLRIAVAPGDDQTFDFRLEPEAPKPSRAATSSSPRKARPTSPRKPVEVKAPPTEKAPSAAEEKDSKPLVPILEDFDSAPHIDRL